MKARPVPCLVFTGDVNKPAATTSPAVHNGMDGQHAAGTVQTCSSLAPPEDALEKKILVLVTIGNASHRLAFGPIRAHSVVSRL